MRVLALLCTPRSAAIQCHGGICIWALTATVGSRTDDPFHAHELIERRDLLQFEKLAGDFRSTAEDGHMPRHEELHLRVAGRRAGDEDVVVVDEVPGDYTENGERRTWPETL